MSDQTIQIKYVGTAQRWPEISITGRQSVWMPGQIESRSPSEASALLATGLFSSPPVPVTAVTGPGGGVRLSASMGAHLGNPVGALLYHEEIALPHGGGILGVVGGMLIAVNTGGTELYRSADGAAWSSGGATPAVIPWQSAAIYEMGDGEVLLNAGREMFRSAGWGSNACVWTSVLTAETYVVGQARFASWGFDVSGQYVLVTEYGSTKPAAHNGYLSTDYGRNFTKIFDQRDKYTIVSNSNAHMHGCCIDSWHATTPRLWVHSADGGFVGLWYSDNLGATWTVLPTSAYPMAIDATSGVPNYTTMTATPSGIVLGTDSRPDGTAVMRRNSTYATTPTVELVVDFHERQPSLSHVAQMGIRVGEWAYVIFSPNTELVSNGVATVPGRIVATHAGSASGGVVKEWDRTLPDLRGLYLFSGGLVARDAATAGRFFSLPLNQSFSAQKRAEDPGWVLGGKSTRAGSSLAVGLLSEANTANATVIGQGAKSTDISQLVICPNGTIAGANSALIAPAGYSGSYASVTGARALGIGLAVQAAGNDSVAVGEKANAAGLMTTAAGYLATATGSSSCALARQATASGQDSVAVGREASATHTRSVALGAYTTSERINTVAVGDRDIELQGQGRGIILRSPNGTLYKLTVSDAGAVEVNLG